MLRAAVCDGAALPAPPSVLLPVLQAKAKRGPPRQAKYAIHCINAMFTNRDTHFAQIFEVSPIACFPFCKSQKSVSEWVQSLQPHPYPSAVFPQPLHKGLDPANLEQLITPLTTLGHLAQLAPEQFAAPLKSLVANFIVKDLLMNDRVRPVSCVYFWPYRSFSQHIFTVQCCCEVVSEVRFGSCDSGLCCL